MIDVKKISGIGEFTEIRRGEEGREDRIFSVVSAEEGREGNAFLVIRPKTLEVRCDAKLKNLLREKYESVMESRYFGRGGIEIVDSGQLSKAEVEDLVRLSYNMTHGLMVEEK